MKLSEENIQHEKKRLKKDSLTGECVERFLRAVIQTPRTNSCWKRVQREAVAVINNVSKVECFTISENPNTMNKITNTRDAEKRQR